jgi:hypothetical protein
MKTTKTNVKLLSAERVATEVKGRLIIQEPHTLEIQIPCFMGLESQDHIWMSSSNGCTRILEMCVSFHTGET